MKWGGTGTDNGQFQGLGSIAIDQQGNVHVIDFFNGRLQTFDGTGKFIAKFSWPPIDNRVMDPAEIAVDQPGNLYVADFANGRVVKFDSSGKVLTAWGSPGVREGQFTGPYSVAVDADGNVYVVESSNDRVQKFRQP